MKHGNHEYGRNNKYYNEDLFAESDDYAFELAESRIKGMTKKQARRFSTRKARSRNKPRSYD